MKEKVYECLLYKYAYVLTSVEELEPGAKPLLEGSGAGIFLREPEPVKKIYGAGAG